MKYHSLTVVLDSTYHDEEVEPIIKAIEMIKGVIDVTPQEVDSNFYTAREQARHQIRMKIHDLLWERKRGDGK